MTKLERLTPVFVSLLLSMGFFLHLTNLGQYVEHGHTDLTSIISPLADGVLAVWMAFCAGILLLRWRRFLTAYDLRGWRRAVYWVLTFYVTASLPGHARYLLAGDTSYFEFFPWWFSPIIMTVYVALIAFLASLRVGAPLTEVRSATTAA